MEKPGKEVVHEVDAKVAETYLHDSQFQNEHRLERIYNVVRDRKDPSVILSMTVMETPTVKE